MLHPTAFLKGAGLGQVCALITDGRFSGGSSGISVGHISPEAAAGGVIGLIEDGDRVVIDVALAHARSSTSPTRCWPSGGRRWRRRERPWQPRDRDRPVSQGAARLRGTGDERAHGRRPPRAVTASAETAAVSPCCS